MTKHTVDCPCCGGPTEVTVSPGEPTEIPPVPPSVEEIQGCDCHLYLEVLVRHTPEGSEPAHEAYYTVILDEALA